MKSTRLLSILFFGALVAVTLALPAKTAVPRPLSPKALFAAECECAKTKCYYFDSCDSTAVNKSCLPIEDEGCYEHDCDTGGSSCPP